MESLVFILIFTFVGALIFSLGLIVYKYKQYDLISGYNTMSEEKKARFDIKRYARIFGIVFYTMGIAIITITLVFYFFRLDQTYFIWYILAIILSGIFFLNVKGWKYKRKSNRQ
jgi:phosphoglycerol transferase MdoB-like AlkP superfamily enzyme